MRRPRVLLVGLGAVALVLLGCTDADAGIDATCADLDASVLDQVEDPGPPDDRPEGAPPDPAELEEWEAAGAALRRLATDGPEELRADATVLAELYGTDPTEVTEEAYDAIVPATDRLIARGAEHCDVDGPVWRCDRRGTTRLVGAPIDGTPNPYEGETPEAVVDEVEVDGERVEVVRTEDRVTFAWLDADELAIRSETVARVLGGWRSDQVTQCDTFDGLDGMEPAPGTVPDDLPPPQSSIPEETPGSVGP